MKFRIELHKGTVSVWFGHTVPTKLFWITLNVGLILLSNGKKVNTDRICVFRKLL